MADDGGGGGGGGEGGGSADWLPIFDRVEAQVEALAADRARLEAADRVQRESWEAARRLQRSVEELEAAAREKDAEIDRLRAEAADARKKLQADASRRGRWEAAYVELLLGANQKLSELRDSDLEDSRTLAENPSFKEVESCTKLNQNIRTASDLRADLRKLKQAYETLSSKKDKELSALLSEKDYVRNQLSIMQQDYAKLLKNKKVEAQQATEAAQKLQQNIDELKVLAQKKDHEISILQAEAVGAKKNLQKMHSLVKEKDDEIQKLKGRQPEYFQKHNKDISETHKKSMSSDPVVTVRDKPENSGVGQTVEEDYISETRTVENDRQDGNSHKRRRASSMSNDDEKRGSDEDDDEQIGSEEDGNKQTGSDDDGDKQTGSDEDGGEQSGSGEDEQSGSGEDGDGDDNDEQRGSDEETAHNQVQKPLGNLKRKRDAYNNDKGGGEMSELVKFVVYYGPGTVRSNELGVDLSLFQSVELQLPNPENVSISQFEQWLIGSFSLDHQIWTVSVYSLWSSSRERVFWELKPIDRNSQWVHWLNACKSRGTGPVALVQAVAKAITQPEVDGGSGSHVIHHHSRLPGHHLQIRREVRRGSTRLSSRLEGRRGTSSRALSTRTGTSVHWSFLHQESRHITSPIQMDWGG